MKITQSIAMLCASVSLATGQSLMPIDRPEATFPVISDAFDGKTTVQRTVDKGGLAHYMIRFYHKDVVSTGRGPYLTEVVLSVTDSEGKVLCQPVLAISGITTVPPDKTEFRMIRFTVHSDLEGGCVLSIGLHKGMRVDFSPFRLNPEKKDAEQDGTSNGG
jgi:hypothetical protein